jgi:RNA exonuclease 4
MAFTNQNLALGTSPSEQSSPSRNRNGKRGGRHRRPRHRRATYRPRSDSDSDSSDISSDSSTTNAVGNHKDDVGHRHQQPRNVPKMDENLFVAIDCEMVGVGQNGKQSSLARVTLIAWNGDIIMDEYVQQQEEVTDYRTFVSGITPEMLQDARMDYDACRQHVLALLEGKLLVGHGLKNDLRVLGITHPWQMTRDTAKYQPFMKVRFEDGILWPRALKDLCQEKLSREVQVNGRPHCPKEDALAALDLYKLVHNKWEKAMEYKINKTKAIEQERQAFLQLAGAAKE